MMRLAALSMALKQRFKMGPCRNPNRSIGIAHFDDEEQIWDYQVVRFAYFELKMSHQ